MSVCRDGPKRFRPQREREPAQVKLAHCRAHHSAAAALLPGPHYRDYRVRNPLLMPLPSFSAELPRSSFPYQARSLVAMSGPARSLTHHGAENRRTFSFTRSRQMIQIRASSSSHCKKERTPTNEQVDQDAPNWTRKNTEPRKKRNPRKSILPFPKTPGRTRRPRATARDDHERRTRKQTDRTQHDDFVREDEINLWSPRNSPVAHCHHSTLLYFRSRFLRASSHSTTTTATSSSRKRHHRNTSTCKNQSLTPRRVGICFTCRAT